MEELKANKQLTQAVVHDLNSEPKLSFPSNSFDAVRALRHRRISSHTTSRPHSLLPHTLHLSSVSISVSPSSRVTSCHPHPYPRPDPPHSHSHSQPSPPHRWHASSLSITSPTPSPSWKKPTAFWHPGGWPSWVSATAHSGPKLPGYGWKALSGNGYSWWPLTWGRGGWWMCRQYTCLWGPVRATHCTLCRGERVWRWSLNLNCSGGTIFWVIIIMGSIIFICFWYGGNVKTTGAITELYLCIEILKFVMIFYARNWIIFVMVCLFPPAKWHSECRCTCNTTYQFTTV